MEEIVNYNNNQSAFWQQDYQYEKKECCATCSLLGIGTTFALLPLCTSASINFAFLISGPIFCTAGALSFCSKDKVENICNYNFRAHFNCYEEME